MHRIRLPAPWQATWLPAGLSMTRKFQRPSGLDAHSHVALEIDVWAMLAQLQTPAALSVECTINAIEVPAEQGSDNCWRAAIDWTKLLTTNDLSIRVQWAEPVANGNEMQLPTVCLSIKDHP